VALVGDGKAIVAQINESLKKREWVYPKDTPWHTSIAEKAAANAAQIAPQLADDQAPANYYRALKDVAAGRRKTRSSSARAPARWTSAAPAVQFAARHRLDAGSYGTMASAWVSSSPRRWCTRTSRSSRSRRFGDRLLRHGDRDGLSLQPAGQDRRLQQRRYRPGHAKPPENPSRT